MSNFMNAITNEANWKKTENGRDALKSTLSELVDIFGNILKYRNEDETAITRKFEAAFNEDPLLAMKLLFYARNIRGLGQGERRFFRVVCKYLADVHTDIMRKNLLLIPEFGRYDDLYTFVGTALEKDALDILYNAYLKDMRSNGEYTFVGKWLKSVNTSSEESRKLGKLTAKHFGMDHKTYRKNLAKLRNAYGVVEAKMSRNNWNQIDYSNVPSKAMQNYRIAFSRRDPDGFQRYMTELKNGTAKVNAGAVYPYEILEKLLESSWGTIRLKKDALLEEQWKALPDYIGDKSADTLCVVDTSGSMYGRPLAIALSLGTYCAERNKGIWHNKMITFSEHANFITLNGDTLASKLSGIEDICENTNIDSVMNLILSAAVNNRLARKDMIHRIILISDMQFDSMVEDSETVRETFTDTWKRKFSAAGYDLPDVIYWNASGNYSDTFHGRTDEDGIGMVSGASPSLFMQVLTGEFKTPFDLMIETLNNAVFLPIRV